MSDKRPDVGETFLGLLWSLIGLILKAIAHYILYLVTRIGS